MTPRATFTTSIRSKRDYQFTTDSGRTFTLNVCRGVASETWNLDESDVAGFVRRDHGDFSIGQVNTTLTMTANAPTLLLSNGSPCPDSSSDSPARAGAVIRFICDTSVYGAGAPALVVQFPSDDARACAFEVEWRTHFACPKGERGVFGGILVFVGITLVLLLTLYTVASTLYAHFVLRRRPPTPTFSAEHLREMGAFAGGDGEEDREHYDGDRNMWQGRGEGREGERGEGVEREEGADGGLQSAPGGTIRL
ncbi:mannose 6-phosphate receptor domain-containing protein [Leucogyrophana mollusca]|uniref:Mannose 6-phosphate receptor domain-containing protein n=1 Tax=Leucogyrophana mollusca TaxID=85980 RepID=A0ACB8BDM6_9AGAM|nr:mannose 6-phosphate receptor domain-containing protein [Leucogyrophana mollusca]